jgi:hypothetical protein
MLAEGSFVVVPTWGPFVYVLVVLAGFVVTALKGRWGFLLLGFLLGGLSWPVTALVLIATPRSAWARLYYGPEKMARAERMTIQLMPR